MSDSKTIYWFLSVSFHCFVRSRRHSGGSGNTRESSLRLESGMWNYDKIAQNQPMAEAFKAFANRALCQESVWFLEEVSRCDSTQISVYTIIVPLEARYSSHQWGGSDACEFRPPPSPPSPHDKHTRDQSLLLLLLHLA